MAYINFFFIVIVLNEYYQYYILSRKMVSLLVCHSVFLKIQFACLGSLNSSVVIKRTDIYPKKTTLNNFANFHQNSMQIYLEEKRL